MSCSILHPITGVTYYLHSALAKCNKSRVIYYFSKEIVDAIELPDGWEVGTAPLTGKYGHGMPFLRKKKVNNGKTSSTGI